MTIERSVAEMINISRKWNGIDLKADFNGIEITVNSNSSLSGTVGDWRDEIDRRAEEYRNSPEGKEEAARREKECSNLQTKADDLMKRLHDLDFNDLEALIDWMCDLQAPSDRVGVKVDASEIITTFEEHGHSPDVNCGDGYDENDMENSGRYLIGQALSCLQSVGAIHHILRSFTNDWKKKFLSPED